MRGGPSSRVGVGHSTSTTPRPRLHPPRPPCTEQARLKHDRAAPELEALPAGLQLDGELVAFDEQGRPAFYRLCRRMLHRDGRIPVVLVAFDVLAVEGEATLRRPFAERRERLEGLGLHGRHWQTTPAFDDGEALYRVVCERGLKGVVAKRLRHPYRPGERGWLKRKNPDGPRFAEERDAAMRLGSRSRRGPAGTRRPVAAALAP